MFCPHAPDTLTTPMECGFSVKWSQIQTGKESMYTLLTCGRPNIWLWWRRASTLVCRDSPKLLEARIMETWMYVEEEWYYSAWKQTLRSLPQGVNVTYFSWISKEKNITRWIDYPDSCTLWRYIFFFICSFCVVYTFLAFNVFAE